MPYNVKIDETLHEIGPDYPNIAYSTAAPASLKFNPSTYYKDYFNGMPNDGNYIATYNTILQDKWGKLPVIYKDKYCYLGTNLVFSDIRSCPTFKRPISSSTSIRGAYAMGWGNKQYTSGEHCLYFGDGCLYEGPALNDMTAIDDFPTYPGGGITHSLLFIDAVGAGGGGGAGFDNFWRNPTGGGGGGGGAFCTCVIDMYQNDYVKINVGEGGDKATTGGATKITIYKTTSNGHSTTTKILTLTCGGGVGGGNAAAGEQGKAGSGGTFSSSISITGSEGSSISINSTTNSDLLDFGVYFLSWYNGKAGGVGAGTDASKPAGDGGSFGEVTIKAPSPFAEVSIGSSSGNKLGVGRPKFTPAIVGGGTIASGGGGGASALSYRYSSYDGGGGDGFARVGGKESDSHENAYKGENGAVFISYKFNL